MNMRKLLGFTAALAISAPLSWGALAADDVVEMVMTNELAISHWKTKYMEEVAADIEKRSNGRIDVKLYNAGQLYKDRDAVAALGSGSVHMVWPVSVQLDSLNPAYGIIDLPFVLSDDIMKAPGAAAELTKMFSSLVEPRGIEMMGLMRVANLFFLFKDRQIKSPGDLKGQKVRVTGGRVLQDVLRGAGASPVTMPASEMTTALALGAIDGIFTSAGGWEMVGDNAKVASLVPGLGLLTYSVTVDQKWLESLDPELQEAIRGSINDMLATQWERATVDDDKTLQKMLEKGGTYTTISGAELAQFEEIGKAASKEFYEKHPEVAVEFDAILSKYK